MNVPPPRVPELDPPQRLLMGPGPANAHPRVLRAMSAGLLGQFDPEFTAYMNDTMVLYRYVFQTANRWTFLIDGSARAAIEAALVSLLAPGERALIVNSGRFGALLSEIAERSGAEIHVIEAEWGKVAPLEEIAHALRRVQPRVVATVHGDTSTTMVQPLDGLGAMCHAAGALLYVDATATLAGMAVPVDVWEADIVTAGLQKCLGGPPGVAPITISDRAADWIQSRRHLERGLNAAKTPDGMGPRIASNYFDLAMLMDYWSEQRLNHHTEGTTLLYGARECARLVAEETLERRIERHRAVGEALAAGIDALGLEVFGDRAHRMSHVCGVVIPAGIDGERIRERMREDFGIEIGTAFGPLRGRIWRIGTMGFNCTKPNALTVLGALEAALRGEGASVPPGAAVDAALARFAAAERP
jgi:(S)-ureidoglycine-glyoxylate aminotransferase